MAQRKREDLGDYARKRDFDATPEPGAQKPKAKRAAPKAAKCKALAFVLHRHEASHLHYDLRLEHDGVLLSFAVPKGAPESPGERRLAVRTENHPLRYLKFKGVIPSGQYGAGTMTIADNGTYQVPNAKTRAEAEAYVADGLEHGKLHLEFEGKLMRGDYALVRTKLAGKKENWLLIKPQAKAPSRPKLLIKGGVAKAPAVSPMLASLADAPFSKRGWLFERKWDGYRAIARITEGHVELSSRTGQNFAKRYPQLGLALAAVDRDALLDGEIIAVDDEGNAHFQWLQDFSSTPRGKLLYVAFDILELEGKDLRSSPLVDRKKLLVALLARKSVDKDWILYSEHVRDDGETAFAKAQAEGWEGLLAKRADSAYVEGKRSRDWLKVKTSMRQEAVICGYTEGRNSRKGFGALMLGVFEGTQLRYVGHVGTGFDTNTLMAMSAQLKKLKRKTSPFTTVPKANAPVAWVEPELVAEIGFQEWTADGIMRQPRFLGLREDKTADVVERERAAPVKLTNLDKIYFPELGLSKGDVIAYYERMAPVILPHLAGRPESLLRHPNGIHGETFFQKNVAKEPPPYVETATIHSDSSARDVRYVVCNNAETLLYMANLGCIELNPWHSRVGSLDRPDYLVLDLDPHEAKFADVITVAQTAHAVLEELELPNYCKTSGKRGLHIYVPLDGAFDDEQVKVLALQLAKAIQQKLPKITSLERSPKTRRGLVYLDHGRNATGQTLAAAYCLRPTPEATVSTPLLWSEVKKGLDPTAFTYAAIAKRLDRHGDLWEPVINPPSYRRPKASRSRR